MAGYPWQLTHGNPPRFPNEQGETLTQMWDAFGEGTWTHIDANVEWLYNLWAATSNEWLDRTASSQDGAPYILVLP